MKKNLNNINSLLVRLSNTRCKAIRTINIRIGEMLSCLKSSTITILLSFFITSAGFAQSTLEHLPPVLSKTEATQKSSVSLLLTTSANAEDYSKSQQIYVNSLQIVDANQPWPPRWYVSTPFATEEIMRRRFDYIIDAKVERGSLSFYKILAAPSSTEEDPLRNPELAGYILMNDKMTATDTIKSNIAHTNLCFHDCNINDRNERLVNIRKDVYLDFRDYTENEADKSVRCELDYAQILDSNNNLIYSWNPLSHLDADLFNYKDEYQRAFAQRHDAITLTRLTSAQWDYDGNILYAMKQVGIGKFLRDCGSPIWQINSKQLPLTDTKGQMLEWYSPHDLKFLYDNDSTATYSLYSNGNSEHPKTQGVVFSINKRTHKPSLIKYVDTKITYLCKGQGNLDYNTETGNYAIGYGFFEDSDTGAVYRPIMEYTDNNETKVYQLPKYVYCYKGHKLENFARPPRPEITKTGGSLQASGNFTEFTWYELSGKDLTNIKKISTGKSFTSPQKGVSYCVEVPYGIGYAVSLPFQY